VGRSLDARWNSSPWRTAAAGSIRACLASAAIVSVFTAMAEAFGAAPPPRLPGWLLRLAAPYVASFVVGTSMRVSNAKAKAELGWHPRFPGYHQGIRAMIGPAASHQHA